MSDEDTVERLFFDLSSETRLGILRKLQNGNQRMPELTRELDLTATETFRQLQRLSEANLVEKKIDGTYGISQLGTLALLMTTNAEFIYRNRQYLLQHAILELPPEFLNRLGELSKCNFVSEMAAVMNALERIIGEAKRNVWIMTNQILDSHSRLLTERRQEGVHFRSLLHEKLFDEEKANHLYKGHIVERRFLTKIDAVLVITENEAAVSFPLLNGNMDPIGYISKDKQFIKWSTDLFLHYWEQARHAKSFSVTSK